MQRFAEFYNEGKGEEENKEEAKRFYIEISKRALEESKCIEWKRDGEIKWDLMKVMEDTSSNKKENWRTI